MAQAANNTFLQNLPNTAVRATADQICAIYQISRSTWWRWSKQPNFPAPARFGRSVRWKLEEVEAFLTPKDN